MRRGKARRDGESKEEERKDEKRREKNRIEERRREKKRKEEKRREKKRKEEKRREKERREANGEGKWPSSKVLRCRVSLSLLWKSIQFCFSMLFMIDEMYRKRDEEQRKTRDHHETK